MRPSTIARIALVTLALGLLALIAINGGLDVVLGILAGILVLLGFGGMIVAACEVFDQ